jgi:hypothetical protein
MSLFADLHSGGIRMPEAVFDQSSMLPTNVAGYGAEFNGVPDARINAGNSLFSDMEPYAYGTGARLSTQTAYLANPHNIQKIVPQLILPDCIKSTKPCNFTLPHSVSDGDVAFSIRFTTTDTKASLMNNVGDYFRQGAGRAVDYVCNLSTINYIIRGLFTPQEDTNPAWRHFACALGFSDHWEAIQQSIVELKKLRSRANLTPNQMAEVETYEKAIQTRMLSRAEDLVRDHFRPIGVVIGSAKQGGQHEVGQKTVTWPCAYIVTVSIDGRNENLCNYWRHLDISSGSDLGFFVHMKPRKTAYILNYSKQLVRKEFAEVVAQNTPQYPQLCPGMKNFMQSENERPSLTGYWHFCMSQAMHQQVTKQQLYHDATSSHVGALILSTVSVVWCRNIFPDTKHHVHGYTIKTDMDLLPQWAQPNRPMIRTAVLASSYAPSLYLNTQHNPRALALQGRLNAVSTSAMRDNVGAVRKSRPMTVEESRMNGGFTGLSKIPKTTAPGSMAVGVTTAPKVVYIPLVQTASEAPGYVKAAAPEAPGPVKSVKAVSAEGTDGAAGAGGPEKKVSTRPATKKRQAESSVGDI